MFNCFAQAISSSATRLSKPDTENPEDHRTHLPVPKLVAHQDSRGVNNQQQQQEIESDWRVTIDERLKKKTRRFNSVCFI